ncbi:MAG TPA: hypothetical protein HPQ04_07055 [Rhodospirillaceae bacterium]|nr:hypothetical protein [Rhodospirillaceae bacterium]
MKSVVVSSLLLALVAAGTASAADGGLNGHDWSLGGAAYNGAEGSRLTLWDEGSIAVGLASPAVALPSQADNMQTGGFLSWRGEAYRLDATLAAGLGGVKAGLGAAIGAMPGELGTSYGLRLGTAHGGERFTINPTSRLGLTDTQPPLSDVNVSFTVNHALTPSLSLIGTAEARRTTGPMPEGGIGQNRYLLGAGLGVRF